MDPNDRLKLLGWNQIGFIEDVCHYDRIWNKKIACHGWVWGRFWTRAVLSGVPARYGVLTNGDELDWIDADIEFRLFLEAPCHHNWQLRKNIFSYRKNFKFFLGHIVSLKSSKINFYGNPSTELGARLSYIVLGNLAKIRKTLTYSNGLDHMTHFVDNFEGKHYF